MKRLFSEIKKSYITIISIFLIFIVFSLFQSGKYIYDLNKQRMINSMEFLKSEFLEIKSDEELMEVFKGNLVADDFENENKFLKSLNIYVKYKDNYYTKTKDKIYKLDTKNNRDYYFNFKKKEIVLFGKIQYKNDVIYIALVKDISNDLLFFKKIVEIFGWVMLIAIILVFFTNKRIINMITKSLNEITKLNENISLDNLKLIRPNNRFIEFESLYDSYEKMLEKLDSQSKKQINFIHSASHELKTPLFLIGANIEILEKYGVNDRMLFDETISLIKNDVRNMNDLVEQLLFIAMSSDIKIKKENIELSNLILEVIYIIKKKYPEIKINFEPKFIELNSDSQLLKILIKNILENSAKYGENKPINIVIDKKEKNFQISIKDNGIGMSEEELENIFTKFYRAESSNKKKGYGLGMNIVNEIINLLGGKIYIMSKKGKGTEVVLTLIDS